MRLAILIDFFGGGGKERRCLQLIKGLNCNNIKDIHVIMIDNIVDYPDLYKTTAKVHIIERHGKYDLGVIRRLYKTLKQINPDVIMTWTLIKMSFYLCLIKPFLKCKYISAIVTAAQPIKKCTIDDMTRFLAFKQADVIVGNSYAGIKAYKAPSEKSIVIYNGFDMERLNNLKPIDQVRCSLSLKTPFMVSMAARINRHKDYQTYIDAAKKVIALRKDVTFYCIGKGELIDYYKNQVLKHKLVIDTGNHVFDTLYSVKINEMVMTGIDISNIVLINKNQFYDDLGLINFIQRTLDFFRECKYLKIDISEENGFVLFKLIYRDGIVNLDELKMFLDENPWLPVMYNLDDCQIMGIRISFKMEQDDD